MLYLAFMKIEFTSQIFKEGRMFVAHTPELDISSCATTKTKALENLQEAVRLFLEELNNEDRFTSPTIQSQLFVG